MNFAFVADTLDTLDADLIALGAFQDQLENTNYFKLLNKILNGLLSRICAEERFSAKQDQSLLVHTLDRLTAQRILLIGLGKREEFQIPDTRRYAALAEQEAARRGCATLALTLPPLDSSAMETMVQFLVEGVCLGHYRFHTYLTDEEAKEDRRKGTVIALPQQRLEGERAGAFNLALARGETIAEAVNWARDLVNEPASVMTPTRLAELASEMATAQGQTVKVLGPKEIDKQKMRLLQAVSAGSDQEPRFIHLTYRPKGKGEPKRRFVVLGKGVTFDAGGLSLKPASSMEGMKGDMAGAAAALGVFRALGPLGVKSEVHVLVPAAENLLGGSACKIGDVVTGLGGKSVEIVNTDAEGRLLLADALAYGAKLQPDEMIDLATLTGGCVVALGPDVAGVMSNDRALSERFLAAARRAGEEVWALPLPARLMEQLKSPVADLKNLGNRWGSALSAGLFLKEFAGKTGWLHLDIAGPALAEKAWGHIPKGGTGFGVASVLEYLRSRDETP